MKLLEIYRECYAEKYGSEVLAHLQPDYPNDFENFLMERSFESGVEASIQAIREHLGGRYSSQCDFLVKTLRDLNFGLKGKSE